MNVRHNPNRAPLAVMLGILAAAMVGLGVLYPERAVYASVSLYVSAGLFAVGAVGVAAKKRWGPLPPLFAIAVLAGLLAHYRLERIGWVGIGPTVTSVGLIAAIADWRSRERRKRVVRAAAHRRIRSSVADSLASLDGDTSAQNRVGGLDEVSRPDSTD